MTTPTENQASVQEQKSDKDINFERIRKQLDQERTARMQAEEKAKRLEEERAQIARKPNREDDEDSETDEPYVDHKHLNKRLSKWEEKMEATIEKKAEEKARSLLDQEKQSSYVKQNPDFQNTLTPENIQAFAEKHPAIAERMLRMPDNFDRQALLYEQIKVFQSAKKEDPKQSIQQTIDQNRRSPFYQPSGVGAAPYAQNGDFSPSGQKNAYAKLQELKSKLKI